MDLWSISLVSQLVASVLSIHVPTCYTLWYPRASGSFPVHTCERIRFNLLVVVPFVMVWISLASPAFLDCSFLCEHLGTKAPSVLQDRVLHLERPDILESMLLAALNV